MPDDDAPIPFSDAAPAPSARVNEFGLPIPKGEPNPFDSDPSLDDGLAKLRSESASPPTAVAPPAELILADDPRTFGLPTIEGHRVEYNEWRAFETFVRTQGTIQARCEAAAVQAGVQPGTVNEWRRRAWWVALFERFVEDEQQAFHTDLLALRHKAAETVGNILDGKDPESKIANAQMTAVTLLTRIGKRPLQDTRTLTQINNNTLNNQGGVIAVDKRKLEDSTDDDLMRMITGELPMPE